MPANMQAIMDDYNRRRAEESASQSKLGRFAGGRHAGLVGMVSAFAIMYLMYAIDDVSSELHRTAGLLLRRLGPDAARGLLLRLAASGWLAKDFDKDDPYLVVEPQEGLRFITPVGLAAGFDREAVGVNAFLNMGFGFVEVGPVVAGAEGDEEAAAAVEEVRGRLAARERTTQAGITQVIHLGLVGVAVGGPSGRAVLGLMEALGRYIDYFVIDIASLPASLCEQAALTRLVAEAVAASNAIPAGAGPAVFLRARAGGAGVEVAAAAAAALAGGASGLVLAHGDGEEADADAATAAVRDVYRQTDGRLVLISSGSIENGREAMDRVEAGATVVQISSLLIDEGPVACRRLKCEMSTALSNEGYTQLRDAVGAAHRKKKRKTKNVWKATGAPSP